MNQMSAFSNNMTGSKLAKLQDTGAYYSSKKDFEKQRSVPLFFKKPEKFLFFSCFSLFSP